MQEPRLSELYCDTRERLTALVDQLDPLARGAPVPTCPGWSVHDVVAHLTSVVEDALAGRLTGPPTDEQTAAQVARWKDREMAPMLATWTERAPAFEEAIESLKVWPAVLDVAAHEQDIRGAVDQPGARDTEVVRLSAERLIVWMRPPVPLRVRLGDDDFRVGPEDGDEVLLRSERFEVFRWRLGRRSRNQLAALEWTGDSRPLLDHLTVFGPARRDIVE